MSDFLYPTKLKELAQPYFFKALNKSETLVILVHGFGASATETRPLGRYLQEKGYDVDGVLLAGHGTKSKDMDNVKCESWFNDIKENYEKHKNNYSNIVIGGISLGGALTLYSATKLDVSGIFTINAFYKFPLFYRFLTWILHFFKYHKPRNEERIKWYLENNLFSYPDDSTYAAYQIIRLLKKVHKKIGTITAPALVIQSMEDQTVNPRSGEWIYADLDTDKELLELPEGDHILTVDEHRTEAFEKINDFVDRLAKGH